MGAGRGVPLDSPWSAGLPAAAAAAAADSLLPLDSMDVPVSNTNANPDLGFFSADWSLPLPPSSALSLDENLDPSVRQFFLQQQQQIATPFLPELLWTSCQYSGFQPPLYSPIPPPTASCDGADAYLMGAGHYPAIPRDSLWQPQQLAWGPAGLSAPSAQLPPAAVNPNLNHAHYIDDAQPCSSGWPPLYPRQTRLHDAYPRQSLQPLHTSPYDQPSSLFGVATVLPNSNNDSNNNTTTNPPRLSCEKVGVWAHKAYTDLLASIHAQKRHHEGGSSAKTALYPRPPRISGLKKNAFRPQPQSISSADAALPTRHGSRAAAALDAPERRKRMRASIGGEGGDGYHPDIAPSSSHAYPFPTPIEQFRRHSSATGHRRYMPIRNHPLILFLTARSAHANVSSQAILALETLHKICSESNWTWVDGMLLGGCLSFVCFLFALQLFMWPDFL